MLSICVPTEVTYRDETVTKQTRLYIDVSINTVHARALRLKDRGFCYVIFLPH